MDRGLLRVVSPDDLIAQEAAIDGRSVAAEGKLPRINRVEHQPRRLHRRRVLTVPASPRRRQRLDRPHDRRQARVQGRVRPVTSSRRSGSLAARTIFARLIATKVGERPRCSGTFTLAWTVRGRSHATPDPMLPENVLNDVQQARAGRDRQQGPARRSRPIPAQIRDRMTGLIVNAKRAAIKKARIEADSARKSSTIS